MAKSPSASRTRRNGSETPKPEAGKRPPKPQKTRLELLAEFEAAPPYAVFAQIYVAAVRDCSTFTIERDRWAGIGVPFIKPAGTRQVRYRKSDILAWLESHGLRHSTSETVVDVACQGQTSAEPMQGEASGKRGRGHGRH